MNNILKHRRTIIPFIAKKIKAHSYLEIGVKGGKTFLPVKVRRKFAVDPVFKISKKFKYKQIIKYFPNIVNSYFQCTSDYFFSNFAPNIFNKKRLDLVFLDGLHTFKQTYKDFENTIPYLNQNGIILIHDCSPKSSAAAYPASSLEKIKKIRPKGFTGLWSGDVWKVIPLIRHHYPQFNVFVIDNDSGIGVVTKRNIMEKKSPNLQMDISDIESWDYNFLDRNRELLLNIFDDKILFEQCKLFT